MPLFTGTNVTPPGSVPLKLNVAFGFEFAVATVKLLACPTTNVALFTLVIRGGLVIVMVKDCVAAGFTPLEAVRVIG